MTELCKTRVGKHFLWGRIENFIATGGKSYEMCLYSLIKKRSQRLGVSRPGPAKSFCAARNAFGEN